MQVLITDGMFYGTSGVLTSEATHHPELDFAAICSGYADDWSPEAIHALRESLLPHAQLVAKQVSAQWVMDARRVNVAEGAPGGCRPACGWSGTWIGSECRPTSDRAQCRRAEERAALTFASRAGSRCRRAATIACKVEVLSICKG